MDKPPDPGQPAPPVILQWARRIWMRLLAMLQPAEQESAVFARMIQDSPSGIVIVDAKKHDMPIVYVNKAYERSTGYSADEVIGKNPRFLQGDDRQQAARTMIREAVDNRQTQLVVLRNYRKDGSMFWNELRVSPVRNRQGEVTHYIGIQNDITAQKEAEDALAHSERRHRQMFDNNRAIKLLIDPKDGRIIDANQAALRFYGYPKATMQTMYIQDINSLPAEQVQQEMSRAVSEDRSFFEFHHRLANGQIREVDVFSSPMDTPDGPLLYSIVVDVTGKRRAEVRYRALFEQSNDAVFILDLQGNHIQVNQRAADMLGYTTDEIQSLSFRDVVVPQQHQQSEQVLKRLLAGECIPPYERIFRRKDGTLLPTDVNVEIVFDERGEPLHIQSIVRDISDRKRAEKALRDSENRYRTLINTMAEGVVLHNSDGVIIASNPASQHILGLTEDQIMKRTSIDPRWQTIHEDGTPFPGDEHPASVALRTGEPQTNVVMGINRTDGQRCWITVNAQPLLQPETGMPEYIVVTFSDITRMKQAQEREIAYTLERERMRLLSQFIQNAAHEFRTPLSVINSSAYLIQRLDTSGDFQNRVSSISEQVERITSLVDMLLTMVRVESQPLKRTKAVDVAHIAETVAFKLAAHYQRPHSIHTGKAPALPTIEADVDQLSEAFKQILDNAFRFTDENGHIVVDVALSNDAQCIEVAIADNGPGIAAESLPMVFDSFWRSDDAHSTPGFGLGLSIAKRIIEQHHGSISITSELHEGTTVQVSLPISLPFSLPNEAPARLPS